MTQISIGGRASNGKQIAQDLAQTRALKPTLEELEQFNLFEPFRRIAAEHRVGLDAVRGRGRGASVHRARAAMWRYLRTRLGWSYPDIGNFFGRDHATVMSAVPEAARRDFDPMATRAVRACGVRELAFDGDPTLCLELAEVASL